MKQKNKKQKKIRRLNNNEILIYDPSSKKDKVLKRDIPLHKDIFDYCSRCDICGKKTEFLVDYFAMVCQDCKHKHIDIVLLKRIGELIEENKKLIKENEKLSIRPIRRIRYPQDFKDKFKWRPKPISIR